MIIQSPDRPRFREKQFDMNPQAPVLEHFKSVTKKGSLSRDRFGNRIFLSQDLSYLDNRYGETKAAMLISPQGERFIKENAGILNDIDGGLVRLKQQGQPDYQKRINLGNNRSMEVFNQYLWGVQSEIYILRVGEKKFVTKIKKDKSEFSQPYVNEMLQCQSLAVDLKKQLDELGVEIPQYLFASSEVALRVFEEGVRLPYSISNSDKLEELKEIISNYLIKKQSKGINLLKKVRLWENVQYDIEPKNIIERPDGKLVCIDPFYYLYPLIVKFDNL